MKRILVDESICMGCHLCEVYCQLRHADSSDPLKAFKRDAPRPISRLNIQVRKPIFFSLRCQQCTEPSCESACLTGAISHDPETGQVTIDEKKCIGCWTCILACPYGSIRQDTLKHKSVKCDLCQGDTTPACVLRCPNEALTFEEIPVAIMTGVS